ncbi:MAG: hypothetical protein IPM63_06740 [Acidobacteriota bacterium]|nr:MAG: hypothetical protein IPM63_06740 [Acidobacteriota bacterium]
MQSLVDELGSLADALVGARVDYAVCGGLSLAIHGYPRATLEIDLLIKSDRLEDALEVGRGRGFSVRREDHSFKGGSIEIRRISKIDSVDEILTLDFVPVTPELADVWDTREVIEFADRDLWVVSRDGLLKMNRISGRPQDLVDIDTIENDQD